jgi:hypothetical protein
MIAIGRYFLDAAILAISICALTALVVSALPSVVPH